MANARVFVEREQNARIRLRNTSGAAVKKEDFVLLGKISGVALENLEAGAVGAFHVEEGILLQVAQADFDTAVTFTTANAEVYYDGEKFSDASGTGKVLVGQVVEPTVKGVMRFAKFYRTY